MLKKSKTILLYYIRKTISVEFLLFLDVLRGHRYHAKMFMSFIKSNWKEHSGTGMNSESVRILQCRNYERVQQIVANHLHSPSFSNQVSRYI